MNKQLARMAHKLKTPLSLQTHQLEMFRSCLSQLEKKIILNNSAIKGEKEKGGLPRIKHDLTSICHRLERSHKRMWAMVEEFINNWQAEGITELTMEEIDLPSFIKEIEESFRALNQSHGKRCGLQITYDKQLKTIWGNREKLLQALENIIDNALRYSPYNSDLGLAVEREIGRESVIIKVSDQGPGMDDRIKEKVLSKEVKVDIDKNNRGLGLQIVKEIVDAHKGEMEIETRNHRSAEDGGCCLLIRLVVTAPNNQSNCHVK